MKVSVKVGSRKVYVEIYKSTTGSQLVKACLEECKISSLKTALRTENYTLFERALGIEREIQPFENIFEIWLRWSLQSSQRIEFIVRMCNDTTKKLQIANRRLSLDNPNPQKIFKIYKAKYMTEAPVNFHVYDRVKVVSLAEPVPVKVSHVAIRKSNKQTKYLKSNNPLLGCIKSGSAYKCHNSSMERLINLEI